MFLLKRIPQLSKAPKTFLNHKTFAPSSIYSTHFRGKWALCHSRKPLARQNDPQKTNLAIRISTLIKNYQKRNIRYCSVSFKSFENNSLPNKPDIGETENDKPILTELHYGRTRVYTTLPPASTHSPTSSKSSPATSSPPLYWQWQPHTSSAGIPTVRGPVSSFMGSIKQSLSAMFLPVGYPETVHECYAKFHIWLALETFIGSSTGVLCSQAMLSSLGLGHAEAAAGAVAIQWYFRMVLENFFSLKDLPTPSTPTQKLGKWYISEIFAITGYFLQLCTCIAKPAYFLPLASLGNAFESIQYSIFGATHMAFIRNFALSGNIGDIVAKDDAQMSLAHLLGMLCGVGLITISHEPAFLFSCFAILAPLNMSATIALLNSAQFEILNQAKLSLIARQYIDCGEVPTMEELKDREIGFGEWIRPKKSPIGVKIRMGVPASDAFRESEHVRRSLSVLGNENYLLNFQPNSNIIDILYHSDTESNDVIKSILHSLKFHDLVLTANRSINSRSIDDDTIAKAMQESHSWTNQKFGKFVAELDDKDWQSDVVFWKDKKIVLSCDMGRAATKPDKASLQKKTQRHLHATHVMNYQHLSHLSLSDKNIRYSKFDRSMIEDSTLTTSTPGTINIILACIAVPQRDYLPVWSTVTFDGVRRFQRKFPASMVSENLMNVHSSRCSPVWSAAYILLDSVYNLVGCEIAGED
ncbi:hypothetical protein G9A89_015136 [Geosiphon pyriformis]|nr:hypothetical protein G9A89_015136 [Geosiphon pyriformis]